MVPSQALRGGRLTATSAALIAAFGLCLVILGEGSEGSLRAALRLTARTSLAFFVLSFTAASSARRWPNRFTRWQLESRHDLAWCLAASHALHAMAIGALASTYPVAFGEHIRRTPVAPGVLTYALIGAFALSSSRAAAAPRYRHVWSIVNTLSALVVWAGFFKAVVSRIGNGGVYPPMAALLLAAMFVRLATARAKYSLRPSKPKA